MPVAAEQQVLFLQVAFFDVDAVLCFIAGEVADIKAVCFPVGILAFCQAVFDGSGQVGFGGRMFGLLPYALAAEAVLVFGAAFVEIGKK